MTSSTLKASKARIDPFDSVQTSPRDGIAKTAAATRRWPKLFRKFRVLLTRRLDPLIAPFKDTEPALLNEYTVVRKLVSGPSAAEAEQSNVVSARSVSTPALTTPAAKAA